MLRRVCSLSALRNLRNLRKMGRLGLKTGLATTNRLSSALLRKVFIPMKPFGTLAIGTVAIATSSVGVYAADSDNEKHDDVVDYYKMQLAELEDIFKSNPILSLDPIFIEKILASLQKTDETKLYVLKTINDVNSIMNDGNIDYWLIKLQFKYLAETAMYFSPTTFIPDDVLIRLSFTKDFMEMCANYPKKVDYDRMFGDDLTSLKRANMWNVIDKLSIKKWELVLKRCDNDNEIVKLYRDYGKFIKFNSYSFYDDINRKLCWFTDIPRIYYLSDNVLVNILLSKQLAHIDNREFDFQDSDNDKYQLPQTVNEEYAVEMGIPKKQEKMFMSNLQASLKSLDKLIGNYILYDDDRFDLAGDLYMRLRFIYDDIRSK